MLRNKFLKAFMILGLLVMQFQSINATDKHVAEAASLIVSPGNMNGDSDGYGYVKLGTTINPFNGEKVFQLWHSSKGFSGTTFYVDAISGILYSTGDRNAYRLLGRKNDAVAREARVFQPAEFNGALEGEILDVHMNEYSTILLTSTGELWYTGDAGNDNTIASLPTVDTFHKINPATFDGKVVEIESFDGGTFVLTEYNTLYFSGNRGAELLGSSFGDKTQFAVAPNPEGKKVVEMWGDESGYTDGDERHIRVKTEDGSYYGVGEGVLSAASGLNRISNSYGWLPVLETRNGTIQRVEPNSIVDFKTYDSYVTFAVRNDGTVWVTGNDDAAFDMVSGSMGTGHYNTRVFEIYPDYGNDNTKLFEGGVTGFVAKEKTNENGETELNLWVSGENYRDLGTVFPVDSYQDSGCPVGGPAVCPLAKPVALVSDDNYFNSTNWNKTEPFMPQYIIGGFDNSLAVDQDGFLRSAGYTLMANSMAYETQAIFPPVTPDSTLRTEEYYPNNADNNLFNNITNPQVSGNARVEGEYKLYETIYVAKPTASFDGFGQAFEESQENTLDPNTITMGPVRGNDYAFDADGTKQFDMFMQYNVYKYNSTTGEFLNEVPGYSGVQNINDNLATLDLSKLTTGDYVVRMSRYTVNDDGEKYVSLTIDEPFRIVNAPVLTVPEFTEVPHNANFEVMDGVSVTDTEDNDAELYNKIIATPSEIDTSVPGTYKVDYTVTDSHNNTVSKSQVVVVNDGTIEIGEKYILQALDYSIHRKNVDVNNVLVDASVKLNEKETGDSLPVTTDTISVTYGTPDYNNASTQEEASKDYPITFGVIDEPTLTNDIIATVSNAGPEILGADYTEIDEGKTFNALAGVSATDKEDGDLTSELVVTGTVDTNTPDLYVLTYTVTDSDDNTSTVKRVVVVKGEGVTVGNDYVIKAQNFTQGVGEVDSANVANFASVKIYDKDGNELSVSDTVNVTYGSPSYANAASTTVDTTAVYPITFTHKTDSTTTITVNGSVTNYAPVISGEKTVVVEKDAIVDTTEGLTVTDVEDDDSTIEVFGGTLYTDTEGVFKVDITATDSDGNTTTFTRVYLVDGEIIDYFENYAIMAEDFVKTVSTAKTETVIDDANVKVYELFTGNLIDADSNVIVTYGTPDYRNASTQTKFVESYPINFKVANEPETTIDVTAKVIIDDAVIGEDYALIASDFTIDLSETPEYMDTDTSDIITSSNARAEHLEDGSAGTPAVVSNGIQPKVGSYKVVINVEEEPALQKEIIVTVKDSNTVIGENYGLKAENFKITVDQAADYMDADIADVIGENGAKVVAWELATNNSAEVALASNGIKATEGVYPVEIYVVNEPTTKKTVYVTVTGDNGALTGDEDILLVAHNFTVDLTNNETLPSTIAEFIELAKVEAINTADGSKISDLSNLSVDPATMAGYTDGLYEVVFTLADESGDAVVTVNALVIDDNTGTGIIDGVNYAVTADDFVIDKRSGSGYQETDFDSSAKIVAAANAKAINADTMEVDTTKTLESNKSSFVGVVAGVYETTYTISNTTISGVANVLVMDDGSTVGNDGVVINGYNFTINSEEAKTFTSNDVITNGNVSAFNKDTLEVLDVVVNATDLAVINTGVSGVYPVELSVNGSETTKTIYVTVKDDNGALTGDGEFLLNAYDFTVDLTKGETLPTNINEFVTVANAKITNTQTGEEVTDYSNLSTAPATMAGYTDGLYEVVFTLADESGDAVLTVNALVIDENTGTGIIDGVNYAVTANDFVIDKRSGSDYTSTDFDSSAKIVAAANAVAINADTREVDTTKTVVSNPSSFVDSAAGVYETTYTIENTSISGVANVLVMDDESTVGNDGVVINGSNFTITSEVAKTLTSNDVITTGNVSAFNKDTLEVYNVVVNASNLAEINKGISGVYPVTLNVNGSFTAKTIYVTVTDDNGALTGDGEFLLNAYDFTVDLTKGETLPTNINEFVTVANAKITNTQTGEEVTDYSNLSTAPATMAGYTDGLYEVVFTLADESGDAVLTVNALVIDENTGTGIIDGVNYAVTADDFVIDKRSGSGYTSTDFDTSAKIVAAAKAVAINADTMELDTEKVIVSNPSTFVDSVAGVYETTYTIENTTISGVANVLVIDDESTVGNDGVVINGSNFTITSGLAMSLNNEGLVTKSNASAFNKDTLEVLDVVVNATNLAAINTGVSGVYPVELSVNGSETTKTIFVTVIDDNGVLTGDGEFLLNAYDFTVDLTKGETLPTNINEFVTVANAKITNTQTGEEVTDYSNLSTAPATMAGYTDGLYEVVFTLADESGDAVLTVNALVIDENTGTGIIDGVNYAVTADDFVIDKRSGSDYTSTDFDSSAKIVAAANAVAINADTMELDTEKVIVSNPNSFVDSAAGVYETTYTIENTTISGVANVLVMDDESTVGNDGVVINGSNFTVTSEVAKTLTSNDVITTGNVSAFNKDTLEVYNVVVNASNLAEINKGISGVYPVTLNVNGSFTAKTIYVTVTDDNGTLTGDGEFLLNAYNFTVDLTKGETLPTNINEFVELANAKITNTQTGEEVTDYSNLSTAPATMAGYTDGLYEVVFTLADESGDAVLTVNALVIDENTGTGIIDGVNYAVTADDFVIDKRSGSGYTSTDFDSSAKIVAAANAKAINADTMELDTEKVIVSNPSTFVDSAAGVYETTYTIEGSAVSGVANVLVMDDSSVVGIDGVVINGSNFTINSEEAKVFTSNDVITNGNVSAFNKDTLEVLDVVVNATDLAAINTGVSGVYPVELGVSGSETTKTIFVTVIGDNGVLTGDGEFLLNAYDFTVDLTKGETLPTNINEFVTVANAKITNTQTGEVVTDYSNLSTAPATMAGYTDGLYEVVFTLADESGDAVLTVNALVIDDNTGTGIIDGVNYAVTANDFVIDKRSESSYVDTDFDSSAKIVAAANAVAINADSREVDTTKTVVSNPSTFVDNVAGIYETTYTIENSAVSGVANVLIIDDNSVVGTDGVVINGSNFAITDIEAKALTASDVVTISNASAFNKDTFEVLDVVVNATDLAEINKGVGGVYPVELGVSGSETTKTIFVTVTDRNSIITEDGEYLLQAYDFVVDLSKGEKLPATIEEFVQLANAKITNTQTGEAVTDYSMLTTDPSTLEGHSAGIALVKFTYNTNPDVETTVGLMVVARIIGTPLQVEESQYALAGHSASVHENDLNNANLAEEFELALEVIVEGDIRADYDLADAVFTTNGNPVKDLEPGIYLVDIVLDDLYLQLPLVVTNDYTVIDNNKVLFVDNTNLKYTDEEATGLTFEDIVNDSNARAFVIETQEQLPLTTLTPEVVNTISQGTPGEYEVSIKANPEAFVNIEVVETQGLPETGGLTETGGVDYLVWFLLILLVLVTTRQVSKKLRK